MSTSAPQRRHVLAIEVSNPSVGEASAGHAAGVALGTLHGAELELLGHEPVRPSGRGGHDDDLMPAIDRLFRRAGMDARAGTMARVGASIGPGGYTSVRVACAVAKMIAEVSGAACVAVPTASVIVESLSAQLRAGPVAVGLAGKGESAWVQVFDRGEPLAAGRLMTAVDVAALNDRGVRVLVSDRYLPAAMRAAADAAGVMIREPTLRAESCLRLAARLSPIDPAELVPLYPREPDAVTLWRARKQG